VLDPPMTPPADLHTDRLAVLGERHDLRLAGRQLVGDLGR